MWAHGGLNGAIDAYFVPRSIARFKPPVWRVKWNPRSSLWRWVNTLRATRRIAFWATAANTALRSSWKTLEPKRARPSIRSFLVSCTTPHPLCLYLQPIIAAPQIAHKVPSSGMVTFKESMTFLKKNGTWTFNNYMQPSTLALGWQIKETC